jgi:nucleoside-diphosphate-sugar epimerase
MKLLIIGGTRFLGRHLVDAALTRGHEVTLFNRGTHPAAFFGGETIRGDRTMIFPNCVDVVGTRCLIRAGIYREVCERRLKFCLRQSTAMFLSPANRFTQT